MPKMYIISGCNGSGKTTASYSVLPELLGCSQFVNSDEFAKSLSPFDPSAASVSASRLMLMKFKYLMEHRKDFCIETTLATRALLKTAKEAREDGYEIITLYLWLKSPEIAISRIKARVAAGGHNIPDDVVRRRYYTGLRYFFDEYCQMSDKWILADNTKPPFMIVAEGGTDSIDIYDKEKYDQIWNIVHPAGL